MISLAHLPGQGVAYADLPPTLQPHAVTAAAPQADQLRLMVLSGGIYLALVGAVLAVSALAPKAPLAPARGTHPERTFVFDPIPQLPRVRQPMASIRGQSGVGVVIPASAPEVPVAAIPEAPSASLPAEAPHAPAQGLGTGRSHGLNATPDPTGTETGSGAAAMVHDFSMTGLAVLQRVDPIYPDFARRARIQGTVVLLMTVDTAGLPMEVQVLDGPVALREAAIRAARQWRFVPARMDGQPVAASFRLTLKFALR